MRRALCASLFASIAVACSSSTHADPVVTATAASLAGPADAHCGANVIAIDPGVCNVAPDAGAGGAADYGPTMVGSEGDDDDCKYHVKWSAAGAGSGGRVTFTVTLTTKKTGAPLTGAPITIEAFLDDTHPAPNTTQTVKETSPGTYAVGPIAFDVSGKWTVRFHVHDECNDSEASPHGHAAFFAQVDVK